MINVTNSIKKAYNESTTQYDKIILNNQEYFISNVQYVDDCYLDGNIFGTAIARTLEFEIENIVDLEKKDFKYLTGIKTENEIEWIDLGTFITQEVEPNDTAGITKVTAMDYMLKSNIEYVSSLNYESGTVTVLQVLQEACQEAGITLATTNFANASFIVDSNQFTEGSLIRQVFQAVAQISGTFAKIRYDDKLYLITPKRQGLKVKDVHKMKVKDLNKLPVSKLVSCNNKIKMSDYSELILQRNTHPINLVSLGMSDVEGENVVKRDEESIAEDGENSLVINDNPFAYTEEKRNQLITALFNTVKGFEYTSFEITGQAKPYQETGDEVIVIDKDGTFSYSFLFRFNYKSPNGLESEMSAPSIIKATVAYQNIESAEQIAKRTELRVDKQEQTITGIIEQQTEQEQKLTEVEQTVDGITQTVSSVETKVEQVEDKADSAQSTADSATQKAETAQDTADTAQTSANNAQATADGAVNQITTTNQKVSQIEQTVNGITQSVSEVEEKVETVETKADNAQSTANTANQNAQNAQSTANSINNNLATNYYTKTETNSQINQKANEITSTVSQTYSTKTETANAKNEAINSANASTDEKLQDYSTTEQMNSAITQKADSITSEVSKTYSTKTETTNAKNEAINSANASTDEKLQDYTEIEELGTLIEQNWEHVKVAWNQISQYIQLEGDNGDATMGFYGNNTKFAEMGVNTIDDDRYISFAIPVDYSQSISDGMAWGVQTKTDNKFHPILYVKNFTMQDENSEGCTGELVLDGCDLVLGAINSGIISNNVKIHGDALPGIYFTDTSTGRMLLGIIPANGISEDSIYILDNISFYRNAAGSNSFKIGNDNGCLFSDDGHILCENLNCNQNVYIYGYLDAIQGIRTQGYVSGKAFIDNSREETKKNIEKFNKNAVEIIKNTDIYEFNYKTEKENAKKHLGFVIGENYNYVKEITAEDDESKEIGADLYSMISVAYKAIQEQQEIIDSLKSEIEELKGNKK